MARPTLSHLNPPTALEVDPGDIRTLFGLFDPKSAEVWRGVEYLAWQFLTCDPTDSEQSAVRWHHLLTAAGNFKRSSGPIVPVTLPRRPDEFKAPPTVTFPRLDGGISTLSIGDPEGWRVLTDVDGLGVPTATTVLSAL